MSFSLASLARSGAWSVVSQAIQMVGALALSVVVVRALTPGEYGVLSLARQIAAFVVIVSGFALERTSLRFLPELLHEGRTSAARSWLLSTVVIRSLGWGLWMILIWVLAPDISRLLGTDFVPELRVGGLTALIFSLYNQVRAAAIARFATATVAMASAVGTVVTFGTTIYLLSTGRGIIGVLIAAAVGIFVATLIQLPAAWGSQEAEVEGPRSASALTARRVIPYTAAFALIGTLNHIVHSQTEIYFLAKFVSDEAAGHFQLGFLFSQRIIDFLPLALWEVSMAGFSHIVVSQPERLSGAFREYLTLLFLLLAPLTAFGVGFSGGVFHFLYGADMLPSVLVARSYFVIGCIAAFNAPVGMILYAREHIGEALRAYIVFATVNLALDILLIPRLGLWGAVLGLGAAKILNVLMFARIAWREVPDLSVPWRFLAKCLFASTPALLWWPFEARYNEPWQLIAASLVAVVLVIFSFRLVGVLGPEERALVEKTNLPLRRLLLAVLSGQTRTGTAA